MIFEAQVADPTPENERPDLLRFHRAGGVRRADGIRRHLGCRTPWPRALLAHGGARDLPDYRRGQDHHPAHRARRGVHAVQLQLSHSGRRAGRDAGRAVRWPAEPGCGPRRDGAGGGDVQRRPRADRRRGGRSAAYHRLGVAVRGVRVARQAAEPAGACQQPVAAGAAPPGPAAAPAALSWPAPSRIPWCTPPSWAWVP